MVCKATGRTGIKNKVSTIQFNKNFNDYIQVDYEYVHIHNELYEVLKLVNLGTKHVERLIKHEISTDNRRDEFSSQWIYRNGASKKFCTDHELCRSELRKYLSHNI